MSELELQSLPEAPHYINLGCNKKCGVLLLDVKSVFYLAINTYVCEFRSMLRGRCVQDWLMELCCRRSGIPPGQPRSFSPPQLNSLTFWDPISDVRK